MGKTNCSRCNRWFSSRNAIRQHYEDSPSHNQCEVCKFDGTTWDELLQHCRKTKHRIACQGCDDGEGVIWVPGSIEYNDHLQEYNVCKVCEGDFTNPNNLFHHQVVHLERSIECYGCEQKFTTYPGMIIHLESGTCGSEIDVIDLNESAAMCFQWKAYLYEDYYDDLLNCCDLESEYGDAVYPFYCPTCCTEFSRLSGLLQHVYSKAYDQNSQQGAIGKLVRWLERRHN